MVPLNSKPSHRRQISSKTRSNAFVLLPDVNKENHNINPPKYFSSSADAKPKFDGEKIKKKTITLLTCKKRKNKEQNEKKKMKGKTMKKRCSKRK